MTKLRLAGIGAGIAAALTIGGCAYDDYGRPYDGGGYYQGGYDQPPPPGYDNGGYDNGYPQGGYDNGYPQGGYDNGAGYGDGGYDGGYYQGGGGYDGFVDGPDYGYGYGWYNDFYYPGFGVFIYDRGGHRHPWRSGDRDYWSHHPRPHGDTPPRPGQGNWRGPMIQSRGGGHVGQGGAVAPSDARGRWRGYDRGAPGGNPPPAAYMRRPMTQDQRDQIRQNAPGQPPLGDARDPRGAWRGRGFQGQAPQGQPPQAQALQGRAPQGRAFQATPGVAAQPAAPTPRAPMAPSRGGRAAPDNGDTGGHRHHHDD